MPINALMLITFSCFSKLYVCIWRKIFLKNIFKLMTLSMCCQILDSLYLKLVNLRIIFISKLINGCAQKYIAIKLMKLFFSLVFISLLVQTTVKNVNSYFSKIFHLLSKITQDYLRTKCPRFFDINSKFVFQPNHIEMSLKFPKVNQKIIFQLFHCFLLL